MRAQRILDTILIFMTTFIYDMSCADSFENGPCTIGNGKYVCSLIHNCDSIYRETRKPGFNFYSLHEKRCGFKKDMFLVCCPDKIFTPEESTPINLSPDDIKHTVFFNTPFGIGVRGKTGRADAACEKYSNDISNALHNHIAQGKPTKPDEFPHMAALIYDVPEAPWQCGGALISHRYVLTAAHCFNSRSGPPIKVILGTNDLTDTKTATNVDVERIIKHPNYVSSRFYFDIGLVLLKEHIDFTTVLRPACLNTEPITIATDSLLTVTGFGKIGSRPEDPQSSLLLQTDLNYIPLDSCNYTYVTERPGERQLPYGLDPGQFCAQDKFTQDSSKQTDSCTGDSGGPLQIRNLKFGNTSVIFGVVSVGQPCPSSSPGIYTNVFYYLDWIESIVWPTPP